MISFFKRILTPPVFYDEIKNQQAYMLHIILWTLLIIPLPYIIFSFFAAPESITRVSIQLGVGTVINIILLIMLRWGFVDTAAIIQTSAFWLFFTYSAFTGAGVQGVSYLIGFFVVIIIAGILLGGKGTAIFTFLSLVIGAIMVRQHEQGYIDESDLASPVVTWFTSVILFSLGALLQHLEHRRVKKSLIHAQQSEERYRLISQVSSDYTFSTTLDIKGNMQLNWVAGAFEKITGYTYDEYVATGGWVAHLHPDDVETDLRDMEMIRQNKNVVTEVRTITKNRNVRWVRVYGHPVWDQKNNKLTGIVGAVQDITEHKRIAEREASRQASLEKVLDLGKHITETKDLKTTYKQIWQSIRYDLGFDRLGIYIYDPERNYMNGTFGTDDQGKIVDETEKHISLAGKTLETKAFLTALQDPNGIYFTHQYASKHDIEANPEMKDVKDFAAIAAWSGNKPVAVLCVDNANSRQPISDEQLELLRLFAGYAGLAIDNARLHDALQNELALQKSQEEKEANRRAMLEKVLVLGQLVTGTKNTKMVLEQIWRSIHHTLGFDRLAVFIFNSELNTMDSVIGTDTNGNMEDTSGTSFPVTDTFKTLIERPDGLFITHNYDVEYNIPEGHEMYGVKDYAAIAAWSGDKPIAVISVDQLVSGNRITDAQLEALRLFAGYAGLALENARLNEALQSELDRKIKAEERESKRRAMLEKVVVLGQKVTEVSDLNTTVARIWHAVHDDIDLDRVGIYFYNDENKSIDMVLGTDDTGNMDQTTAISVPMKEWRSFKKVLENHGSYYFTQDYSRENNLPEDHEMFGVKDHAMFVAWGKEIPVALIVVDNKITQRPITNQQLEALNLFIGYVGLAIENSRLNQALQTELNHQKLAEEKESSRRAMLEQVLVLGQLVTETKNTKVVLEQIWRGVHHTLGFDRLAVFLFNSEQNTMDSMIGTDTKGNMESASGVSYPISDTFKMLLEKPDGVFITHNYDVENTLPEDHEMYGVKDYAAVAAWAGDKPIAVISVDQLISGRRISDAQLEALRLFAGYAGLALENARLNEILQSELTQRQTLIDELEAKNAELERFTYTVSHDLKSPLVTISGFLGYLEQDAINGDIERIKSGINRITAAAAKMQALLNDLLELSRVGRIMNKPEDVPFAEIVNEAIDHVHGKLNEVDALVESQSEYPIVHGDRVRLVEVVQNLIENAVKYSRPRVKPYIEIGTNGNDVNGYPIFFVRDNGIGIEEQYHDNIFGLFNKLDAQSDGTGIGLSLVKRIIEVHNGRIWVRSEKGSGTTFYFTLPTPPQTEE